jgi:hypothetical protein
MSAMYKKVGYMLVVLRDGLFSFLNVFFDRLYLILICGCCVFFFIFIF